jgi:hypothetical protein
MENCVTADPFEHANPFLIDSDELAGRLAGDGTGVSASTAFCMLANQVGNPFLDEGRSARLWVSLRLFVPRLVVLAMEGDSAALSALYGIRGHLDRSIEVPWRHLPDADRAWDRDGPPDGGAAGYELMARLKRYWDAALSRATSL